MRKNLKTITDDFYIVCSKKTKMPYLDRQNNIYLFDTPIKGMRACKGKDLYVENIKDKGFNDIISFFYSIGASSVVYNNKLDDFCSYPIPQKAINSNYYNRVLASKIIHYLQQDDTKGMSSIGSLSVILPVKVAPTRLFYHFEEINQEVVNLAFLDLDDFSRWNTSGSFIPLEVNITDILNINDKALYIKHKKMELQIDHTTILRLKAAERKKLKVIQEEDISVQKGEKVC